MEELTSLTRRQVRYWLFRFRVETESKGAPAEGAPVGLREYFEEHAHFLGWEVFGITWDVSADDPYVIVPLRHSLETMWNTEAMSTARELPLTPKDSFEVVAQEKAPSKPKKGRN